MGRGWGSTRLGQGGEHGSGMQFLSQKLPRDRGGAAGDRGEGKEGTGSGVGAAGRAPSVPGGCLQFTRCVACRPRHRR